MLILGIVLLALVLLALGLVLPLPILFWIGLALAVIGAVLIVRPVGGRRWY